MRATVQTARRLLAVTLVAGITGAISTFVVTIGGVRALSTERVANLLAVAIPESALAACHEGHPRPVHLSSGVDIDFYGPHGAALYDGPQVFDAHLMAQANAGNGHAAVFDSQTRQSRAVFRLENVGDCSFAQAAWRHDANAAVPYLATFAVSVLTVAVLLTVLVALFVVRPLLRQLRDLRAAAVSTGTSEYRAAPEWADEAGEISRALNASHARIQHDGQRLTERSASLERALAEIGHDVRTPLASLQIALDELADQLPETALPVLRRALNDVVYLRSLTSNLRLASWLREGAAERAIAGVVCISDIVQRAVERSAPFALRRGIDLTSEIAAGLLVPGDDTGSEQALTNLLENAIAYSPPGAHVLVRVTRETRLVRVVVEDDGPGVVSEALPTLGSSTFRSERERSRDGRGTGLGLAITRAICERSGWSVHFEQVEPTGLRAVIQTPLAEQNQQ